MTTDVARCRGERLISLRVNGKPEPRGKVTWIATGPEGGRWVFYRDVRPELVIRFCNGLSVDAALLGLCEREGIAEIHYRMEGRTGKLYVSDPETVRRRGIARTLNGRAQHILPLQAWRISAEQYRLPHIPAERFQIVAA